MLPPKADKNFLFIADKADLTKSLTGSPYHFILQDASGSPMTAHTSSKPHCHARRCSSPKVRQLPCGSGWIRVINTESWINISCIGLP